jgi:uncharacterized membrane protein YfcA
MKIILYYLVLLVFIALLGGFLLQADADNMSMQQIISVTLLMALYVVFMSLVGEGKSADERESQHRYLANRMALIAGSAILSVGILYQLYTHQLDYWLLAGLIGINLVKIVSLIYSNYKH